MTDEPREVTASLLFEVDVSRMSLVRLAECAGWEVGQIVTEFQPHGSLTVGFWKVHEEELTVVTVSDGISCTNVGTCSLIKATRN